MFIRKSNSVKKWCIYTYMGRGASSGIVERMDALDRTLEYKDKP